MEHTADIAIRVWGRSLAELFANAAYGMACQLASADDMPVTTAIDVALEADDVEMLLVAWLSELLYLGEREGVVFVAFDIAEITPRRLMAVARGGPVVEWQTHIKAVTFSQMNVRCTNNGYETRVVFDV